MQRSQLALTTLALALCLSACGTKGPLYTPAPATTPAPAPTGAADDNSRSPTTNPK